MRTMAKPPAASPRVADRFKKAPPPGEAGSDAAAPEETRSESSADSEPLGEKISRVYRRSVAGVVAALSTLSNASRYATSRVSNALIYTTSRVSNALICTAYNVNIEDHGNFDENSMENQ